MTARHLILDRDGVLNHEAADRGYILRAGDFHWLPGTQDALALLRSAGLRVSVATNQSVVGRGLIGRDQLDLIHARMCEQAQAAGGRLDAVFVCPHAPASRCDCRKPAPGLVLTAMQAAGIPASQTLLVGDDVRDVQAAQAAGVAAVLVRTGKGNRTVALLRESGVTLPVYDTLLDLARHLVAGGGVSSASSPSRT